jgi:hypothetical protein
MTTENWLWIALIITNFIGLVIGPTRPPLRQSRQTLNLQI